MLSKAVPLYDAPLKFEAVTLRIASVPAAVNDNVSPGSIGQ